MGEQTDIPTSAVDLSSLENGDEKGVDKTLEENQAKHEELPELPEGGTKAYLAVLGAFTGMFVSFGFVNCSKSSGWAMIQLSSLPCSIFSCWRCAYQIHCSRNFPSRVPNQSIERLHEFGSLLDYLNRVLAISTLNRDFCF